MSKPLYFHLLLGFLALGYSWKTDLEMIKDRATEEFILEQNAETIQQLKKDIQDIITETFNETRNYLTLIQQEQAEAYNVLDNIVTKIRDTKSIAIDQTCPAIPPVHKVNCGGTISLSNGTVEYDVLRDRSIEPEVLRYVCMWTIHGYGNTNHNYDVQEMVLGSNQLHIYTNTDHTNKTRMNGNQLPGFQTTPTVTIVTLVVNEISEVNSNPLKFKLQFRKDSMAFKPSPGSLPSLPNVETRHFTSSKGNISYSFAQDDNSATGNSKTIVFAIYPKDGKQINLTMTRFNISSHSTMYYNFLKNTSMFFYQLVNTSSDSRPSPSQTLTVKSPHTFEKTRGAYITLDSMFPTGINTPDGFQLEWQPVD